MRRENSSSRKSSRRKAALRVTVLGGGNGASMVLAGLKNLKLGGANVEIRAIVATADDGGSSGRLRRDRGGLPPGDVRNCLLALSREPEAARLFAHRFDGPGEIGGHALGNLILSALADQEGCFLDGISRAGEMLDACGKVLPVSLSSVALKGETTDGSRLSGETAIGKTTRLARVWLDPATIEPAPGVLSAIETADMLVIGPGSLFTSLLAVLKVPRVAESIRRSGARRVLVANLMTQPGETMGMNLQDHLEALDRNVEPGLVGDVICHPGEFDAERLKPYAAVGATPIAAATPWSRPERLIQAELATTSGKVRHDPDLLASTLWDLMTRGDDDGKPAAHANSREAGEVLTGTGRDRR